MKSIKLQYKPEGCGLAGISNSGYQEQIDTSVQTIRFTTDDKHSVHTSSSTVMPQAGTRKRPAPGASPLIQEQSMDFPSKSSQLSNDQFFRWGHNLPVNETSAYPDPTATYTPSIYAGLSQPQGTSASQSNQIARRPPNQQLVARGRTINDTSSDQWLGLGDVTTPSSTDGWANNDEDLEQKALIAKRDAQAKRKPIPPFVQKLSR